MKPLLVDAVSKVKLQNAKQVRTKCRAVVDGNCVSFV